MTTMEVAADFVARGYAPIPIPRGEKRPLLEGWQNLRITDDAALARYFAHDCNVGVLLGEASGGLVDVDLDHPEAVRLADEMLPKTAAIFGRASKRGSHRLYRVTDPHVSVPEPKSESLPPVRPRKARRNPPGNG